MSGILDVKIENFEGPLDLLIHLVYKNEMDIFNISIAVITDQFVETVNEMKSLDMEVASEFIQMATYLLYLKSKMLLPDLVDDEEELDPETEKFLFSQRLIEYSFYKDISEILNEKEFFASRYLTRGSTIKLDVEAYNIADGFELSKIFFSLLNKDIKKEMEIKKDTHDINSIMERIKKILSDNRKYFWSELILGVSSIREIVVYFLSLLELVKLKIVKLSQIDNFSDFIVVKNEL